MSWIEQFQPGPFSNRYSGDFGVGIFYTVANVWRAAAERDAVPPVAGADLSKDVALRLLAALGILESTPHGRLRLAEPFRPPALALEDADMARAFLERFLAPERNPGRARTPGGRGPRRRGEYEWVVAAVVHEVLGTTAPVLYWLGADADGLQWTLPVPVSDVPPAAFDLAAWAGLSEPELAIAAPPTNTFAKLAAPVPARALGWALDRVMGSREELDAHAFVDGVAAAIPVLDGGLYNPRRWKAGEPRVLDDAYSSGLVWLERFGAIALASGPGNVVELSKRTGGARRFTRVQRTGERYPTAQAFAEAFLSFVPPLSPKGGYP